MTETAKTPDLPTQSALELRILHKQICYENGDHPGEVSTPYSDGADAITAWNTRPQPAVTVKPLEWDKHPDNEDFYAFQNDAGDCLYHIVNDVKPGPRWRLFIGDECIKDPDRDDGFAAPMTWDDSDGPKAYAQEDLDGRLRRHLSAIQPAPTTDRAEVLREADAYHQHTKEALQRAIDSIQELSFSADNDLECAKLDGLSEATHILEVMIEDVSDTPPPAQTVAEAAKVLLDEFISDEAETDFKPAWGAWKKETWLRDGSVYSSMEAFLRALSGQDTPARSPGKP